MKKTLLYIIMAAGALVSCSAYEPMAPDERFEDGILTNTRLTDLVTVKQNAEGKAFLQYGSYALMPQGIEFVRQERAMASMIVRPEMQDGYYRCELDWLEPIEEGYFCPDPSSAPKTPGYGLDIIFQSELTRVEDGYLSVHYTTWWGDLPMHHDFYLVGGTDPDDPYLLRLVQDERGDAQVTQAEGLVCFDINSLADTAGGTITITLCWTGLNGIEGSTHFGFKNRE